MNRLKTVILLGFLTGLFMVVGRAVGGAQGMWMGLLFAGVSNFASYFLSDRMVLSQYHGVEVTQTQQPRLYALVARLAHDAQIPMPKLYIIDMPTPNAFEIGRAHV